MPERRFGDPRGIDEAAEGFAEYINDVESELVRIGHAERQALQPSAINHRIE